MINMKKVSLDVWLLEFEKMHTKAVATPKEDHSLTWVVRKIAKKTSRSLSHVEPRMAIIITQHAKTSKFF